MLAYSGFIQELIGSSGVSLMPANTAHELARRLYLIPLVAGGARAVARAGWLFRYQSRRSFSFLQPNRSTLRGPIELSELPVMFINLKDRVDRLESVLSQFARLGLDNVLRFDAVAHEIGILGCTLSHAEVMNVGAKGDTPLMMVCEDDLEFLAEREAIEEVVSEFARNPNLDVLCLAYNLGAKPHTVSELLAITNDTQTAACYVVKVHAREPLRRAFQRGADLLAKGVPAWAGANDVVWKKLQRGRLIFAIPNVPLARQKPSYSDVEGKWVDYGV